MTVHDTTFKKNTDGILNHDGSVRVEKDFDVLQEVVFVNKNEIHLKNRSGVKYRANKHKKLDLTFCEIGDTAFVKFMNGSPYVIGFRKEMRK